MASHRPPYVPERILLVPKISAIEIKKSDFGEASCSWR